MPKSLQVCCQSVPGVVVRGVVTDLEPVYERSAVVAVPVLEGSGTRLKIVDAWRHGKAVVTTSKGIEGLDAPQGAAIVADTPDRFADGLVEAMASAEIRSALGLSGLQHMRARLAWSGIASHVTSRSVLASLVQRRCQSSC
jgi:glycosyltransferase involved in cell wall biosynthesis